jgi:hypothetical protein
MVAGDARAVHLARTYVRAGASSGLAHAIELAHHVSQPVSQWRNSGEGEHDWRGVRRDRFDFCVIDVAPFAGAVCSLRRLEHKRNLFLCHRGIAMPLPYR